MTLAWIDWVIVAVYFVLSLSVGLMFTRRASRSTENYFLAGRTVPWWLAGISIVATTFASDTPLLVTGITARGGIAGNWIWWAFVLSGMLTVFFFRLGGNERRRDHRAGIAPRPHRAVQHVARTAGFVAGAEFAVRRQLITEAPELSGVVGEPLEPRRGGGVRREHGDGHGLLVHIHAEIDDRARHGLVLHGCATVGRVVCGSGDSGEHGGANPRERRRASPVITSSHPQKGLRP